MGPTIKLITAQEHGGLIKRRFVVSARDQHTQSALEHGGGNLTQMVRGLSELSMSSAPNQERRQGHFRERSACVKVRD